MSEKQTFVQRIMSRLQGGDEAKVSKFQKDVKKFLERQVKEIVDQKEELVDKLADRKDELEDAVLDVNINRIKTTEDRKAYIEEYIDLLESKEEKIRDIEKSLVTLDKLLKLRNSQLSLIS